LLRNKIEESGANIFCFQETKRDLIDIRFLKNFAPKRFDNFEFCPSSGASGGILVAWVSRFFTVTVQEKHSFAIRLTFTPVINSISWNLVVVYGPCRQPDCDEFVNWLYNLDLDEEHLWMFMGDFNFYGYAENRNRSGGNFNDSLVFNNIISHLGLVEIPINGRSFTWSNMQSSPLLEQLDWVFTSHSWTSEFPLTMVLPLAKTTSNHLPCKIQIGTNIPKANISRFENYWLSHPSCFELIKIAWSTPTIGTLDSARTISAKLKLLIRMLKLWARNLSYLSNLIANCNMTIAFFDKLEEIRPLSHHEFKFRVIIKGQIHNLTAMQNTY
jgi:hypothetical protein